MFRQKQVIDVKGFDKFVGGFVEIKKGDEVTKGLLKNVEENGVAVTVFKKIGTIKDDMHPINSMMVSLAEFQDDELIARTEFICIERIERIDCMEFGIVIIKKCEKEKEETNG